MTKSPREHHRISGLASSDPSSVNPDESRAKRHRITKNPSQPALPSSVPARDGATHRVVVIGSRLKARSRLKIDGTLDEHVGSKRVLLEDLLEPLACRVVDEPNQLLLGERSLDPSPKIAECEDKLVRHPEGPVWSRPRSVDRGSPVGQLQLQGIAGPGHLGHMQKAS
eukprot:scaffold774_cov248-Pinguiococcus_pyrenoidosus.AAC.14